MTVGHPQAAAAQPFTGMALDRADVARKDPRWVDELAARADARVLAAGPGTVLADATHPALARLQPAPGQLRDPILLGLEDGVPLFAADLDRLSDPTSGGPAGDDAADAGVVDDAQRVISLREAGVTLPAAEAGLAAYLSALMNWHRRNRFCANCGAATDVAEAGYSRHCPNCGADHFPRTDPVVIMSVEHDGRLLLGRRVGAPAGRVSVLAGFVSPGESAEEAVVREVREESSIVVGEPVYVTSQPWPFPASLMLGFHAIADGGEPTVTDGELAEVAWYDANTVRAALRGEASEPVLPPPISIAHHLIERWAVGRAR
ncbi:MAG TPA: NAD(+) diphosphatase [Solirubrobacteraceae bacterium]|nr:NAD(+) diphosphatase [Solirubrobacteraceae bacterium]